MKRVLNPKLNNEKIVTIEYYSTKEELEYKLEERNQNETKPMGRNCEEQRFPNFDFGSRSRLVHTKFTKKDINEEESRELLEIQ